jgi:hypothetical protein
MKLLRGLFWHNLPPCWHRHPWSKKLKKKIGDAAYKLDRLKANNSEAYHKQTIEISRTGDRPRNSTDRSLNSNTPLQSRSDRPLNSTDRLLNTNIALQNRSDRPRNSNNAPRNKSDRLLITNIAPQNRSDRPLNSILPIKNLRVNPIFKLEGRKKILHPLLLRETQYALVKAQLW